MFVCKYNLVWSGKVLLAWFVLDSLLASCIHATIHEPGFSGPIINVTAPLGREAILGCSVHNLSTYKVAWLRVDTQTILTIHTHVISRSRRVGVTHDDHHTWFLHIRELRESDRGWYMCQINTDPMKSQLGYLDIVVPPDILDRGTSSDQTLREGGSISLTCATSGSPQPTVTWRREHGRPILLTDGIQVTSVEGPVLNLSRISRQHSGAYLCIASNGVPPTVSKRIIVTVELTSVEGPVLNLSRISRQHSGAYLCIASNGVPPTVSKCIIVTVEFPPVITIRNQLVGAALGTDLVLECDVEAYPKPVSYWSRETGEIVPVGGTLEPLKVEGSYRTILRLPIRRVTTPDYGSYKCVSKNSLGDTEGSIKVYPMPPAAHENKNNIQQRSNVVYGRSPEITSFGTQDFRLQDNNNGSARTYQRSSWFLLSLIVLVLVLFPIAKTYE